MVGLESPLFIHEQFGVSRSEVAAVEKRITTKMRRSDVQKRVTSFDFWQYRRTPLRERAQAISSGIGAVQRLYQYADLPTLYLPPAMKRKPETVSGLDVADALWLASFVALPVAARYFGYTPDLFEDAVARYGVDVGTSQHYTLSEVLPLVGQTTPQTLALLYPDLLVTRVRAMRQAVCVPYLLSGVDLVALTAQQWYAVPDVPAELIAEYRGWPLPMVESLRKRWHDLL